MGATKTTDVAGLMQYIVADAMGSYMKTAVTPNAVWVREAPNAQTVYFPALETEFRTATASAHTEGAAQTASGIGISQITCALSEYSIYSQVSKLAIKGGDGVEERVGQIMGRQVANKVDSNVCALISGGVDGTVVSSDGFSMSDLFTGVGTVDAAGFAGERKVAILHPLNYWGSKGLATDLIGTAHPQANAVADQVFQAGWVNNIGGVDIYLTNQVAGDAGGTYKHCVVMAESCIGLGVHTPLIELDGTYIPATNTFDLNAASYHKAVIVHAGAGYHVQATV